MTGKYEANPQGMPLEHLTYSKRVKYRSGYKYQLAEDLITKTDIFPPEDIEREFITLYREGILVLKSGYACDGPSGPTKLIGDILEFLDGVSGKFIPLFKWLLKKLLNSFIRGAFVHDGLFQLFRQGVLSLDWKTQSNIELKKKCLEDGMSRIRAWYVYNGVMVGADYAASPENKKQIHVAPELK